MRWGPRLESRQHLARPPVDDLHDWMRTERGTMSRRNPAAQAIAYMVKADRCAAFTRLLDDGRVCLANGEPAHAIGSRKRANAERALRGIALGRKSWLFAGSKRGGDRTPFMYSLIVIAKLNDIDPQAWLADVLGRLPDRPASQVPDLLPWNWKPAEHRQAA